MGGSPDIPQYKPPSGQPGFMQTPGVTAAQVYSGQQGLGWGTGYNQKPITTVTTPPTGANWTNYNTPNGRIYVNSATGETQVVPGGTQALLAAGGFNAPGVDPNSPYNQALMQNVLSYQMSDQDLAYRFPGFVQARQSYQDYLNNMLGAQTTQANAAGANLLQAGQTTLAQGQQLGQAGLNLIPTSQAIMGRGTSIIDQGQNLAATAPGIIQTGQNIGQQGLGAFGTGQQIAASGQPIIQQGLRMGTGLIRQGQQFLQPAGQLAGQAQAVGQPDINLGQTLISGGQPMDPLVQQALMQGGLQSAAGALGGAAALGGTAGQAAVGRQLGVGAQNWINQQRQMGMQLQQTGAGLTSGYAGAAGTLAGAGANVVGAGTGVTTGYGGLGTNIMGQGINYMGAGTNLLGQGINYMGAGTGVANAGANLIGAGTGVTNAGTGVFNAATGAVGTGAQAALGGANISATGQNIMANQAQMNNQAMALASGLYQPRAFGISGADAANIALANYTGQNNMNQFLYSTKVQGAQYNQQAAASNAQAGSAQTGQMISGGIGVATSAAMVAAAFCWVAAEVFGRGSQDFNRFRFWLLNCGPKALRRFYIRNGKNIAAFIHDHESLKPFTRLLLKSLSFRVPCLEPMNAMI